MKIEISDETVDLIFNDVLLKDYNGLLEDIKRLESKSTLEDYEQADLKDNIFYLNALRMTMDYYGI